MTEQMTLAEMGQALHASQQAFLEMMDRVDDETLYQQIGAENWTLAETLVHMAEARQFFVGETRKALAAPQVAIGRTVENEARLKNIEEHGRDALATIRQRMLESHTAMIALLQEINDDQLALQVEHVAYGPQSLGAFLQRFFIGHDQAHVQQAKELLGSE